MARRRMTVLDILEMLVAWDAGEGISPIARRLGYMRTTVRKYVAAAEALGTRHELHIANYGPNIEERLTGHHETASYKEFFYGVSHRGASVRIPWQVAVDKKGYIEDRRPNANMDPYVVNRLIVETVCGVADGDLPAASTSTNGATRTPVAAH